MIKTDTMWLHLHEKPSRQIHRGRNRVEVARGEGRRQWGVIVLLSTEFQFCKLKGIQWLDGGDGSKAMYFMPLNFALKMAKMATFKLWCVLQYFFKVHELTSVKVPELSESIIFLCFF